MIKTFAPPITNLCTAFFLLFGFLANGQKNLKGKVVDAMDGQPLIGAQVFLRNSQKGTLTDDLGYFEIQVDSEDNVLLIKYLGYEQMQITIPADNELGTIALKRSNTTLSEVIVSASSKNFKSEFKGSNFRINPVSLQNINPLNTEEVLRTIPGVNIVGDMGLSNRPNISIRGSWGRRSKKVLLMEDGTPSAPAP